MTVQDPPGDIHPDVGDQGHETYTEWSKRQMAAQEVIDAQDDLARAMAVARRCLSVLAIHAPESLVEECREIDELMAEPDRRSMKLINDWDELTREEAEGWRV